MKESSNPKLKKLALLGAFSDLDSKQQQNDIAQQDAMLRQAAGMQSLQHDQTLLPAQLAALQAGTGLTAAQTTALPQETALHGREMALHESTAPYLNALNQAQTSHLGVTDEQAMAMLPFMMGEAGVKLAHMPESMDAQSAVQRAQAQSYMDEHDAGTAAAKVKGLDAQSQALLAHAAGPYMTALFGQNTSTMAGPMGDAAHSLLPGINMDHAGAPEPQWLTNYNKTLPQSHAAPAVGDSTSPWEHLGDALLQGSAGPYNNLEMFGAPRITPRVRDFRHAFSNSK